MCVVAEQQDKEGVDGKLPKPEEKSFKMHLFGGIANIFEYVASCGMVHEERVAMGMDLPTGFQVTEFFIGLVLPFYSVFRITDGLEYEAQAKYSLTFWYFTFYALWIVLFSLSGQSFGYVAFGFTCFFMNACILTPIRMAVRERYSLEGNIVADFIATSFFYPQALCQMLFELQERGNAAAEPEVVQAQEPEQIGEA